MKVVLHAQIPEYTIGVYLSKGTRIDDERKLGKTVDYLTASVEDLRSRVMTLEKIVPQEVDFNIYPVILSKTPVDMTFDGTIYTINKIRTYDTQTNILHLDVDIDTFYTQFAYQAPKYPPLPYFCTGQNSDAAPFWHYEGQLYHTCRSVFGVGSIVSEPIDYNSCATVESFFYAADGIDWDEVNRTHNAYIKEQFELLGFECTYSDYYECNKSRFTREEFLEKVEARNEEVATAIDSIIENLNEEKPRKKRGFWSRFCD